MIVNYCELICFKVSVELKIMMREGGEHMGIVVGGGSFVIEGM
jgi:hypothetical protein